MSKRRTRTALVVAFVVMGVAVLGLAAAVYAKYIASIEGKSASVTVAKWAFKDENENTTLTCPLEKTYNPDTLVGGKIAPGTKGTCEIQLANTKSEVGVDYEITISKLTGPANVVFKYGGETLDPSEPITGMLIPGEAARTITINWEWPYSTNATDDAEDTVDGRTAAGYATTGTNKMEVTFNVSGTQVQPN